ncbi:MAG: helix-turn-helix domain-containing protein [Actinomycetota bacterium]|nr:helix-turn-helix domain-containing protein [Actinomycetota bacterium]
MNDAHELLTVAELAKEFKISPRTVYDWRYRRVGPPALKVGGQLRYRRRDVEAWLDGGEAKAS